MERGSKYNEMMKEADAEFFKYFIFRKKTVGILPLQTPGGFHKKDKS